MRSTVRGIVQLAAGAFIVYENPDNPRDIRFDISPNLRGKVPKDQSELQEKIESTLTLLRALFPSGDKKFDEYFSQILSLSQAGLVGENAQPQLATNSLAGLRNDIVIRESGPIKNIYLKRLGLSAIALSLLVVITTVFFLHIFPSVKDTIGYCFLWVGSMIGVFLSFASRRMSFSLEELPVLRRDPLEPFVRLIFTGLATTVIGLLLSSELISVNLGNHKSIEFKTNWELALLLGALCGISEKALAVRISGQAKELLGLAGK
jgi:hypothetical protein